MRLDIDYPALESHRGLSWWKKRIIALLHNGVDIVSAETEQTCEMYNDIFGIRPLILPVGYAYVYTAENGLYRISNSSIEQSVKANKEKIIMTAGRLGTKQKATEVLLEAFAITKKTKDWKLVLAGSIEQEFRDYIEKFRIENREIIDKIEFIGNITDKERLYDYYRRASIFAMPSRWGSAETVIVEALSQGDYIIMSDMIPSYNLYTDDGKYGRSVPVDDVRAWTDAIDEAVVMIENGYDFDRAAKYGQERFNWKEITSNLHKAICDVNGRQ